MQSSLVWDYFFTLLFSVVFMYCDFCMGPYVCQCDVILAVIVYSIDVHSTVVWLSECHLLFIL
jgi:hypothetical protein